MTECRITGSAAVVGVIGCPVGHSLSPIMHNAAYAAMGLAWVYVPFSVQPADLPAALAGLAALGVQGVNVTIPHKQAVIPFMTELTPAAEAVGSVNTIAFTPAGMRGHSTDGHGFLRGLSERGFSVRGARAVVLGGGGAARAVVGALAGAGAAAVTVVARTPAKAAELPRLAERMAPAHIAAAVAPWDEGVGDLLAAADLVVNATSIGMAPCGAGDIPVSPAWLHPGLWVYDLVYTPRQTALLQAAAARGCPVIDGVAMLVYQGAEAITFWTGQPAPVAVMEAALTPCLS